MTPTYEGANGFQRRQVPLTLMRVRNLVLLIFCISLSVLTLGQGVLQALQAKPTSNTSTASDPLGRNTPSNSVLGFLKKAQEGDYSLAAQYLQMNAAHRQTEGEQLATQLKFVLDHSFQGNFTRFDQPEGILQEDVPAGRQKLGTMSAGDVEDDLDLVRVNDPAAGKIWLISADTLAKVPELYDQSQAREIETKLPAVLVKHQVAGMPLWQWLALLLAVPLVAGLAWMVLAGVQIPVSLWAKKKSRPEFANWREVSGPAWMLAATILHQIFAVYLRMPLLPRHYYFQATSVALILSATWIVWRVVRWSLRRVRMRALARGHAGTGSLILMGERVLKATIFVLGLLAVFASLGFNMSTALAGLGIGGIAIGFGAQQTVANLFGGMAVLADEVFHVGDVCRFGDRTGVVEDIGLRSTRIRTDERTLVAIPNGTVATINLENFTLRDKILFKTTLGLHPDTKADHTRWVLSELRKLLEGHAKVEKSSVRVRLTDIAGSALSVEVVSYIVTRDFNEFAAVREELLLRMMDIMENSGGSLAPSAQTIYITSDGVVRPRGTQAATGTSTESTSKNLSDDPKKSR